MAAIHPEGYRLAARALAASDTRAVLSAIDVPTLIVWGEHDTVCPRRESERLAAAIPGAGFVVIPRAGHVSNQENPIEFNRVLREFLTSVDAHEGGDTRSS
jgi:pimeloyl-ACP methyl ester carboxylesterase